MARLGACSGDTKQVPTCSRGVLLHSMVARRNRARGPSASGGAALSLSATVRIRVPIRRCVRNRLLLPSQPPALRCRPLLLLLLLLLPVLLLPLLLLLVVVLLLLFVCLLHHHAHADPSVLVTPITCCQVGYLHPTPGVVSVTAAISTDAVARTVPAAASTAYTAADTAGTALHAPAVVGIAAPSTAVPTPQHPVTTIEHGGVGWRPSASATHFFSVVPVEPHAFWGVTLQLASDAQVGAGGLTNTVALRPLIRRPRRTARRGSPAPSGSLVLYAQTA